jgi:predicted house-cleaning noncanonical NTP pyrophosphatase (MazG superfamily)
MSIKQNEHREAYHITDQEDYDNLEEKKEEEEEEEYDEVNEEANQIITALENIMAELKGVDKKDIQEVVDTILNEEDKQELYKLYYTFFHDLPNNNSIKVYVLHLFNELCMPITRNTDEFKAIMLKHLAEQDERDDSLSDIEVEDLADDLSKSIV